MWLIIDDIRTLGADVVARTANDGLMALRGGSFDCLMLDHDLGEDLTGYDVLCIALRENIVPSRVQLVTSNLVGRDNMARALMAEGYSTPDRINYYRST